MPKSKRRLQRPLAIAFAVLGIGLVAAIALQVHLGLAPLRRLASDLRRVRDGEQPGLPPQRYDEIRPLSEEINALLDANRTVVQRARGHLADLSHALKTPLSVVRNVLDRQEGDGGSGLRAAELMERLIERRLGRARAQARPHNSAALAGAVIDDIVLVVSPLARRRGVFVETNVAEIARFAGDRDDLAEMIGPLAENACAHAGSRVVLAAWREDSTLVVTVEDDGPGMTETEVRRAIERGERLAASSPGSTFRPRHFEIREADCQNELSAVPDHRRCSNLRPSSRPLRSERRSAADDLTGIAACPGQAGGGGTALLVGFLDHRLEDPQEQLLIAKRQIVDPASDLFGDRNGLEVIFPRRHKVRGRAAIEPGKSGEIGKTGRTDAGFDAPDRLGREADMRRNGLDAQPRHSTGRLQAKTHILRKTLKGLIAHKHSPRRMKHAGTSDIVLTRRS